MANLQNLQSGNVNHTFTPEEVLIGNQKSIETRQKKASMRKSLELLLNSNIKIDKVDDASINDLKNKLNLLGADTSKMKVEDLVNAGLILGAIFGNANNYKTIIETKGEMLEEKHTTPTLLLEVVDNSKLEKTLYEENKYSKNASQ
jgi:hypothetical protein